MNERWNFEYIPHDNTTFINKNDEILEIFRAEIEILLRFSGYSSHEIIIINLFRTNTDNFQNAIHIIEESRLILNITTRPFGVISFARGPDFPTDSWNASYGLSRRSKISEMLEPFGKARGSKIYEIFGAGGATQESRRFLDARYLPPERLSAWFISVRLPMRLHGGTHRPGTENLRIYILTISIHGNLFAPPSRRGDQEREMRRKDRAGCEGRAINRPHSWNLPRFRAISLSLAICAAIRRNMKIWGRDLKSIGIYIDDLEILRIHRNSPANFYIILHYNFSLKKILMIFFMKIAFRIEYSVFF